MNTHHATLRVHSRRASGFSLVELMIALVLGLIVVGSALAIFLSNRQTYTATESLGRTQENIRLAFELMSKDLRQAGSTPCGNSRRAVGNVLNGVAGSWYDWQSGIVGFDGGETMPGITVGTATGNRVAGTDAIALYAGNAMGAKVESNQVKSATEGEFVMTDADHGLVANEIVVACDYMRGAVFQINAVDTDTITYSTATATPGNASINLGGCLEAAGCAPGPYVFQDNAIITRLGASRWYVGVNDRGGRSLFLQTVQSGAGSTPEEIAEGVENLQVQYLLNTNANYFMDRVVTPAAAYTDTIAATDWDRVLAVRLVMSLVGPERVDGDTVDRTLTYTVNLRNQNT